jgi:mRNA-degrading endonuclease HigB of HigAB toxin-antitoxin module
MQVIGRPALSDFAARHPEAAGALRALVALLEAATWRVPADLLQHWGAIAECDASGRVRIDLPDAACAVALQVSYAHQLVCIETVSPSSRRASARSEEVRREPERSRRASHPHRGRLRPGPA